ncbi:MAG: hypothetical protein AAF480_16990 [Actinomycetota bacterium]
MRSVLGVLVAALVAAACSGDGSRSATEAETPAPTSTPEPTVVEAAPTPTAPVVDGRVIEIEERSVVYGGVVFSPLVAEISNEDPTSRENGLGLPSTGTYLHLTIGVENPMSEATLTLDDRRFFSLRVDGTITPAPLLSDDIAPRSAVRPGVAGTMRASWEVPVGFTLSDGALVVGPAEARQAILPLAGLALTASPTLRAVPVDLGGSIDGVVVCGPTVLRIENALATSSADLPADVADSGGLPRRAFAGQTFLETTVAFTVVSVEGTEDCAGTIVSADLIAFTSDGTAAPDGWVDGPADVAAEVGDTVAITVGTMVNVDAQVRITVGRAGGAVQGATVAPG